MQNSTWLIFSDIESIENAFVPDVKTMQVKVGRFVGYNSSAGEPVFEWGYGITQTLPLYLHIIQLKSSNSGIDVSVFQDGM